MSETGASTSADNQHSVVMSSAGAAGSSVGGVGSGVTLDEEKLFGEISSSEDETEINIDEDSESEQVCMSDDCLCVCMSVCL